MCLGLINNGASHRVLVVKNWPANTGDIKKGGFDHWAGKIPWSGKWQPTPVFLPGESHEQRSLVGYNPWGHRESDMTEESLCSFTFDLNNIHVSKNNC